MIWNYTLRKRWSIWENNNIPARYTRCFRWIAKFYKRFSIRRMETNEQIIKLIKCSLIKLWTMNSLGNSIRYQPMPVPNRSEQQQFADQQHRKPALLIGNHNDDKRGLYHRSKSRFSVGARCAGVFAKEQSEIEVIFDLKFFVGKRNCGIVRCIKYKDKIYGIEVPAIKTFERSGGVAAFYAAKIDWCQRTSAIEKADCSTHRGRSSL